MSTMCRFWRRRGPALLLSLALVAALAAGCQPRGKPGARGDRGGLGGDGKLEVTAFYDDDQEKPREKVLDLVERYRREITYLAPFWYSVKDDGTVMDESQKGLKDFARRDRIRLEPLVTNLNGTDAFLTNPTARGNAVRNIAEIVRRERYAGVSIDFQLLEPSSRDALTAFVKELRQVMPRGKVIGVDVIPFLEQDQAHEPYDYRGLAKYADRIILMTYDRHGQASAPGAVAPLDWVREVLDYTTKVMKPDKIVMGLASYGYDWPVGTGKEATVLPLKRIPAETARKRAAGLKADIMRDKDQIPHYTYTQNGVKHEVWFEDDRSIVPKLKLAKERRLHGVAIWRVGYEDRAFWEAIRRNR